MEGLFGLQHETWPQGKHTPILCLNFPPFFSLSDSFNQSHLVLHTNNNKRLGTLPTADNHLPPFTSPNNGRRSPTLRKQSPVSKSTLKIKPQLTFKRMWRAYKKIHKFSGVISNFSTKEWFFGEANTRSLWSRLSTTDQKLFQFDMTQLNWDQYFKDSVDGVRIYLFQDHPNTLPAARRKMFL